MRKQSIPIGLRETTRNKLSADLALSDDPATREVFNPLDPLLGS